MYDLIVLTTLWEDIKEFLHGDPIKVTFVFCVIILFAAALYAISKKK